MSAPSGLLKVVRRRNRTRSYAELRISEGYLHTIGLDDGDYVGVSTVGDTLVLKPAPRPKKKRARNRRRRSLNGTAHPHRRKR